jgi:hypothetical protein
MYKPNDEDERIIKEMRSNQMFEKYARITGQRIGQLIWNFNDWCVREKIDYFYYSARELEIKLREYLEKTSGII